MLFVEVLIDQLFNRVELVKAFLDLFDFSFVDGAFAFLALVDTHCVDALHSVSLYFFLFAFAFCVGYVFEAVEDLIVLGRSLDI